MLILYGELCIMNFFSYLCNVKHIGIIIISSLLVAVTGYAQVRSTALQQGIGGANVLDTYLSPEKYRGMEWRVIAEVNRDSKNAHLAYSQTHEIAFGYLHNRALNGHEYVGHYDFSYAVMRKWDMIAGRYPLRLSVGPMLDAFVGFNYNSRNTNNNPAQGYGSVALGGMGAARYTFKAWGRELTLGYELRFPLLGIRYSPNYGQSYYEIFGRGDYDHNICFYSVSPLQVRQQVTADLRLKSGTALRIGYLSDVRQAKPNNLKQHHYYNALLLGVVF